MVPWQAEVPKQEVVSCLEADQGLGQSLASAWWPMGPQTTQQGPCGDCQQRVRSFAAMSSGWGAEESDPGTSWSN